MGMWGLRSECGLGKTIFTAGMVAKILGVAPRTACKLFDAGKFGEGGYRLPTSGSHRRVTRESLVAFMVEENIPLPDWLRDDRLVLVASRNALLLRAMERAFPPSVTVEVAPSVLAVGRVLGADQRRADVVVADAGSLGRAETLGLLRELRAALPGAVLLAVACEDETSTGDYAADGVYVRPFDPALLAARVLTEVVPGKVKVGRDARKAV